MYIGKLGDRRKAGRFLKKWLFDLEEDKRDGGQNMGKAAKLTQGYNFREDIFLLEIQI